MGESENDFVFQMDQMNAGMVTWSPDGQQLAVLTRYIPFLFHLLMRKLKASTTDLIPKLFVARDLEEKERHLQWKQVLVKSLAKTGENAFCLNVQMSLSSKIWNDPTQ